MTLGHLDYQFYSPAGQLAPLVAGFRQLYNASAAAQTVTVLPDGRLDLFFMQTPGLPLRVVLFGLGSQPEQAAIPPHTRISAISFQPLAAEYLLREPVADLVNASKPLEAAQWAAVAAALPDFPAFCQAATRQLGQLLPRQLDPRKLRLFDLLFISHGTLSINELASTLVWSNRQLHRYFTRQYGLPLKTYCRILRFTSAVAHLRQGQLLPDAHFVDQSHFIREVKQYAGVPPTTLRRNENDRFIQLSVSPVE